MQLVLLGIVTIVTSYSLVEGLVCLVCEDAATHNECLKKGRQVLCHENQLACQTEIRYLPNSRKRINKRCKQVNACFNDVPKIFTHKPTSLDCEAGKPGEVCRCCCYNDGCSNDELTSCPEEFTTPATTTSASYKEPTCPTFNLGIPNIKWSRYCTQGNQAGSACRLRCPFPYQIKGNSYISCQKVNVHVARWTTSPPCCTKFCPPFGNMELVIGLDSSHMNDRGNWNSGKGFVRGIIRKFTFSDTRFGFFRFNDKPEVATAISVGQFKSHRDLFGRLSEIQPITKKSRGVRCAPALQFVLRRARDNLKRIRNRRHIFLIVITGTCDDILESVIYSKWLKDAGVKVMGLGVSTRRQDFQPMQRQLKVITHGDHMVFQAQVGQITSYTSSAVRMLCSNSCSARN